MHDRHASPLLQKAWKCFGIKHRLLGSCLKFLKRPVLCRF